MRLQQSSKILARWKYDNETTSKKQPNRFIIHCSRYRYGLSFSESSRPACTLVSKHPTSCRCVIGMGDCTTYHENEELLCKGKPCKPRSANTAIAYSYERGIYRVFICLYDYKCYRNVYTIHTSITKVRRIKKGGKV